MADAYVTLNEAAELEGTTYATMQRTKLVCYIVAIALTTPVMCAMMAFMKMPIEWYMVFGSFLASFVVAKVSMSGWDDVNELFNRLFRVK